MSTKTISITKLIDEFLEFKKKQIKEKVDQHPTDNNQQLYLINIDEYTSPRIDIYRKKINDHEKTIDKEIKKLKSYLIANPKLEITRNYNPDFFNNDQFDTSLIIRKIDDPKPIYRIKHHLTHEYDNFINEFYIYSFKQIKAKLIKNLERDSKKLKKIQKSTENQIDLIISRNLLNHELADTEAQLERLEKTTKRYKEEALKAREKYEQNKENEQLKKEYNAKAIAHNNHKEMLDKFRSTPKNNYTPYEWQAIIAVGSISKQKPKSKIPINPTKFFEVLGIEPKSNQSLNELRDAVLNLTKKPYYSSNLSYDNKKRAFIMTNQVNETPIFELHEINVAMEKNKKKAYGVKVANESILDDIDKNYLRILDILPQIHAYFSRVDSYIYQLCTYIHNARMSYILGNYKPTQTTSIIELIKRTEKKNLLNDDMTGFNIRKNKHSQIKIITSVLEFFVKNNYMKPDFEIEKEQTPYKIKMTFLGDEKIKKIS